MHVLLIFLSFYVTNIICPAFPCPYPGIFWDYSLNSWNDCPAGYSCSYCWNEPTICPADTYSEGTVTACTDCPTGQFSLPGSSSCNSCDGVYWDFSSNIWRDCPAGYRCPSCFEAPTICPRETYAESKSKSCTSCTTGTHAESGSSSCSACAPGKYWSRRYTDPEYKCNTCLIGAVYCPGGDSYYNCPAGTYGNGRETNLPLSACLDCPVGKYGTQTAMIACWLCRDVWPSCCSNCYRFGCGNASIGICKPCTCPTNFTRLNTCDGTDKEPLCKKCQCEELELKEVECTITTDPVCCPRYSVQQHLIYILSFLLKL